MIYATLHMVLKILKNQFNPVIICQVTLTLQEYSKIMSDHLKN